jgi:hypothetical protein
MRGDKEFDEATIQSVSTARGELLSLRSVGEALAILPRTSLLGTPSDSKGRRGCSSCRRGSGIAQYVTWPHMHTDARRTATSTSASRSEQPRRNRNAQSVTTRQHGFTAHRCSRLRLVRWWPRSTARRNPAMSLRWCRLCRPALTGRGIHWRQRTPLCSTCRDRKHSRWPGR